MKGCISFNKPLENLITNQLLSVSYNFMDGCYEFSQDLDFSVVGNNCKIKLDYFMYNCKSFATHQLRFGNKVLLATNNIDGLFQIDDINGNGYLYAFATNDATALIYTAGFHIQSIYSKAQMQNMYINNPNTGLKIYPFRDAAGETENIYRKLVVNGVA